MKEVQDRAVHPNVRDMYEDNALTPILKKRILVMFWMYWMLAVVTDVMSEFYATGEIVVMFWRCCMPLQQDGTAPSGEELCWWLFGSDLRVLALTTGKSFCMKQDSK